MYRRLARMTGLAPAERVFSEPIQMGDDNAVQIDLTVFSGEVKLELQETNNLQDWTVRDSYSAITGPSNQLLGARSTHCSHVRVVWEEATGINRAVIASGINSSAQ